MTQRSLQNVTTTKITGPAREALLFNTQDEEKVEQFEGFLENCIDACDSITGAIEKMVEAALKVEFGEKMTGQKQAEKMIKTLSRGIMSDPELRKQALIVIDRFAKVGELNA